MEDLSAMSRELAANREVFNAMFKARKGLNRSLQADDFYEVLSDVVAPVVEAVDAQNIDVASTVRTLFSVALTLTQRSLLGPKSRHEFVARVWQDLLTQIPDLVAEHTQDVAIALSNAAYNLGLRTDDIQERWLQTMLEVAQEKPDLASFLDAGIVAAWSAGMAHWRKPALEAWGRLDPGLAKTTLCLHKDDSTPIEVLRQQLAHVLQRPAGTEDPSLQIVYRRGGFRGFRGPFLAPPKVYASDDRLFAVDSTGHHAIFADAFGALIERTAESTPSIGASPFTYAPDGSITAFGVTRHFPMLAKASSVASNQDFMAVALPHSHHVWIIAWSS